MDNLLNLEGLRCQEAFQQARLTIRNWQNNKLLACKALIVITIDNQLDTNISAFLASEYPNLNAELKQCIPLTAKIRKDLTASWQDDYDEDDVNSAKFGKVIVIS